MLSPVCTLTCATRIPSSVTIAFSPPASTVPDAITVCSIFPDDGADAVTCGTVMDATTRDAIVKTSMTASKPASPFNQKIPDFPVTAISFSEFLFFLIFFIFSITLCLSYHFLLQFFIIVILYSIYYANQIFILIYILLLHYSFAPAIAIPCSR